MQALLSFVLLVAVTSASVHCSGSMTPGTRPGQDYASINMTSAEPSPGACRTICCSDPRCQTWVYVPAGLYPNRPPGTFCWLKAVPLDLKGSTCDNGKPGCISGVVNRTSLAVDRTCRSDTDCHPRDRCLVTVVVGRKECLPAETPEKLHTAPSVMHTSATVNNGCAKPMNYTGCRCTPKMVMSCLDLMSGCDAANKQSFCYPDSRGECCCCPSHSSDGKEGSPAPSSEHNNDYEYSVKISNSLDFAGANDLSVAVLRCNSNGTQHLERDPHVIGTLRTSGSNQTFSQLTWAVPNSVHPSAAPCVQNLHLYGPFTQWGSAYCTLNASVMNEIASAPDACTVTAVASIGPPGLHCTASCAASV